MAVSFCLSRLLSAHEWPAQRFTAVLTALVLGASVLGTTACSSTHSQEVANENSQDAMVTARVKAALLREDSLKSLSISVKTSRGTVALSGFVDTFDQITRAVAVTRGIEGAEAVRNDLHVKTQ
jgi:osmotically-inducible protein OsmY